MRKYFFSKLYMSILLLSIAFLVFTSPAAFAAVTSVSVGSAGVINPSINQNEVDTEGWTWTAAPPTLTLSSAYNREKINISCAATDQVDIVYTGNVSITATGAENAIFSQGIINISGSGGTLVVTSTNAPAINTAGDLIFSGGTITATAVAGVAMFSSANILITGGAYVEVKRISGNTAEYSIYVAPGNTLTVDSGATLVNLEGTIYNIGTIANNGTITSAGDIDGGGAYGGAGDLYIIPSLRAIQGVTPPVFKDTPTTAITVTPEYTGVITWSPPVGGAFASKTQYAATITLTAIAPFGFTGVPANYFTVAGATTATNAADSGTITAVFPTTSGGGGGGGCDVSGGLFCILALAALGMFRR